MALKRVANSEIRGKLQQTRASNGFGSTTQPSTLYGYISNLFKEYVDARMTDKGRSDKIYMSSELLINFRNQFYDIISKQTEDLNKLIDLDALFDSLVSQDINKTIISEMKTVVIDVLKRVIREKLTANIKNKLSVTDLSGQIKKLETHELTENEISNLVRDTLKGNNKYVQQAQQELGTALSTYRETLIGMFEKMKSEADDRRWHDNQQKNNPQNKIMEKFNPLGRLDTMTNKKISNLCDKLFWLINLSFTEKIFRTITNSAKFIASLPQKILSAATKFIKSFTLNIFGNVVKIFTNGILKPIHYILSSSFKIIGGLTKGIYKTTKFILEKTKAKFLLLTPPGMYALGFLIGFVWEKLKQKMPDVTFSIVGMMNFFRHIFEFASEFYKDISDAVEEFMEKHPSLDKLYLDFKEGISNFAKNFKEKGLVGAIKETDTYQNVLKFYNGVKGSTLFGLVKWGVGLLIDMYNWIIKHPMASSILMGGAYAFKNISMVRNLMSLIKVPIKGNIISCLLGAGVAYGTQAATEGVINMFNGEADMENASWKLGAAIDSMSLAQKLQRNQHVFDQIKDEKILNKYNALTDYISENYHTLLELRRDIMMVYDLNKWNKKFADDIAHGDLYSILPDFVQKIVNFSTEATLAKFEQNRKNKDVGSQIANLTTMISEGITNLISYQQYVNSINQQNIDSVLNSLVDDNLNIKGNKNSEVVRTLSDLQNIDLDYDNDNKLYKSKKTYVFDRLNAIRMQLDDKMMAKMGKKPLSDMEKNILRQSAINIVNVHKDEWFKDREVFNVLQNFKDILDESELQKMSLQFTDKVWWFQKVHGVDYELNNKLKAIMGTEIADEVKQETIEKMLRYANKDQINSMYEMATSIKDLQDIPTETKDKLLKLRDSIRQQRTKEQEESMNSAINEFNDYSSNADSDSKKFILSCEYELERCKSTYKDKKYVWDNLQKRLERTKDM